MIQKLVRLTYLAMYSFMAIGIIFSTAWGTELYIPASETKSGQPVEIPVMMDQTDNLAGVKLVIKYDADILVFKKADKTRQTASLMHIVNDKNPGIIVVVMAGAKGIKGKDFPILSLSFEVKQEIKDKQSTKIEIKEAQLMSDQLKDIACIIKVSPLVILADTQDVKSDNPQIAEKEPAAEVKLVQEKTQVSEPDIKSEKKNKNSGKCTLEQILNAN